MSKRLTADDAGGMIVRILVEEAGCRVLEARPVTVENEPAPVCCRNCEERARTLVESALPVAPEAWRTVTVREREVMLLAATGCSNRVIADRLGISLRTVENHLNRVYGKLGITGRVELQVLLATVGRPRPTSHLVAVPDRRAS
jgi:DNA-binding CsgD family transcriptional regulator